MKPGSSDRIHLRILLPSYKQLICCGYSEHKSLDISITFDKNHLISGTQLSYKMIPDGFSFKIYLEDEAAQEMIDIIQNKLNARL